MLYNEENRAILLDRIECLQEAIDSILDLGDERITESVIGTLYGLCAKHDPSVPVHQFSIQAAVPIDIVHRVIKIPEYLNKDPDLYHLVGFTYLKLKRYDEAIANYDKALKIDPYHASTLLSKGTILAILGQSKALL
jgi:tetratricopeptide (TPR) repeat protein